MFKENQLLKCTLVNSKKKVISSKCNIQLNDNLLKSLKILSSVDTKDLMMHHFSE